MAEPLDFYRASDFREILTAEFLRRKERRTRYSWRSFARDLGVNPATLLGAMAKNHGISGKTAERIAEKLQFSGRKKRFFIDLVESQHARAHFEKEAATARLRRTVVDAETVPSTDFDLISKWFYPAVLELVSVRHGEIDAEHIAERLNISVSQATDALDRLCARGALKKLKKGYARVKRYLDVDSVTPAPVVRNFHRQMLNLAADEIEFQPIERRKYLSTVLSFDEAQLQRAREWLTRMQKEFVEEFGTFKTSTSVYGFGIQLFQLDRGKSK
jgi:uncharacterized protein (TIGR02147 family)